MTSSSLRIVRSAVCAAFVACALLRAAPATDRPVYRAEDFVESIALAASPFDRYLAEGQFQGAGTKYPPEVFFDLGVRYYRMGLRYDLTHPEQPRLVSEWWRKTGARPMLLVDAGKSRTLKADWMGVAEDGDFSHLLADVKAYEPGSIAEIEGPNELNNKFPPQELNLKYKGLTDEAAGSQYQRDLFAALRGDPATADIPVVMYTAIFTEYALARPCDAFDFLNMHSYQGSAVPSSSLIMNMTRTANILPPGTTIPPFVPTECGYNVEEDRTNQQGYHGSRRAQAYNIPMLLAEYFRHGVRRTYLFALHNADGYGLLESDQETKRPSWYALQSFVSLLADSRWDGEARRWNGGRDFAPRALRVALDGAPDTVHSLVLQKESGDWFLLLWNEVENDRNGTTVRRPPVATELTFAAGTPVECVAAYAQGDIPEDVYATPEGVLAGAFARKEETPAVADNRLSVEVPSAVLVLQLRPAHPPAATPLPKAPASLDGTATENAVSLRIAMPPNAGAAAVLVFRNDMHVASLNPAPEMAWTDTSALIRPGLGYRYAAQAVAADGRLSPRTETVILTPDKRPDLVMGDFGPDLPAGETVREGDAVTFRGTIVNAGDGATPQPTPASVGMWNSAVAVTFSVDGKVVGWGGDDGQEPVPAGATATHRATGGPGGNHAWTATAGTHVVKAYVDDINRICGERDKANNLAVRSLTVGDYPGRLALESRPAPTRVNLSEEGTEDWVHFAAWDGKGTDSRKAGAKRIGPLTQAGEGYIDRTSGCPVSLVWEGGEGTATENDTHAGLWGNCIGNGFAFTAPAGPEERILRVYAAGIEGARCEFSAELSDGSAPAVRDGSWDGNRSNNWAPVPGAFSCVYEIRYRTPKPGENLKVSWKLADEPNRFRGQIRLQAATLRRAAD